MDSPGKNTAWSGLPCSPPGDLPDPGIQPETSVSPAGRFFTAEPLGKFYLQIPNQNKFLFYDNLSSFSEALFPRVSLSFQVQEISWTKRVQVFTMEKNIFLEDGL